MGDRLRVEFNAQGDMINIMYGDRLVEEVDAGRAWDFGDDLLIAAGHIWHRDTGQAENPGWSQAAGLTDRDFLEERATGILFSAEQMEDLRALATLRGKTLTQLIREEMLATLEFAAWADELPDVDVLQHPEGEHEDGQAQPAQADTAGDTDSGAHQQDRGDDVKDDGQHVRRDTH